MKKYIKGISFALITLILLIAVFRWGGDAPSLHDTPSPSQTEESAEVGKVSPIPAAPQQKEEKAEREERTCFISVSCDTILKNKDYLAPEKFDFLPQDGILLARCEVTLNEGESVFDVLLRETQRAGIHLEFMKTPVSGGAYIEGIGNLYEFDCGELSGWMYRVNGSFPDVSCSDYILKDGDTVEWVYTCDSGKDVGKI